MTDLPDGTTDAMSMHHSFRRLASALARPAAVLAASAAPLLVAVPAANAQFGGRAGFAEAFRPDIMQRDITLMTSILGLEEWQRPVVEALLEDYMAGFRTGEEAMKDKMKAAAAEGARSGAAGGDAIFEKVLQPLNAWREEKRRMYAKFLDDLRGQLGPQQLERWPSFERAMRRERQLPEGDLSGESTDLFAILARMQLAPAEEDAVKAALADYEVALDAALVARSVRMLALDPEIAEAMRSMNHQRGADVQEQVMALRIAVRAANDAGIESIAAALGARGADFRRRALEAGYPDVYRPHPVGLLIERAQAMESLNDGQRQQLDALAAEFAQALDAANGKVYEAVRAEEPKAPRKRAQAMMDRQSGAPAVRPTPDGDPVVKARTERERMGEPYRERLATILTPEQLAELPGAVKVDPSTLPGKGSGIDTVESAGVESGAPEARAPGRRDPRRAMTGTKPEGSKGGGKSEDPGDGGGEPKKPE